jgi:hypothetical protein
MQVPTPSAAVTPLWIIALFIGLSEAVAGVAAVGTDGATRLIFAVFAVSFPMVVLAVFVYFLRFESLRLFGPAGFANVTVKEWREATERQGRLGQEVLRESAIDAVVDAVQDISPETRDSMSRGDLKDLVSEKVDRAVEAASVTVDLQAFKPGAEPLQIPVTEETTVDFLLDSVYFAIAPAVEPFTYSRDWILVDDEHGSLENVGMGTAWAKRNKRIRDDRLLSEVGIRRGSEFKAVPIGNLTPKRSPFQQRLDDLTNALAELLAAAGLEVQRVPGSQRPRLLAFAGTARYGLYVMPGSPKDAWIELARTASNRLSRDRGESVEPVLVLDTRPPVHFLSNADSGGVHVMWLTDGVIRNAPWDRPGESHSADHKVQPGTSDSANPSSA